MLSNVNYKIFAEVLTNLLESLIADGVGDHETCGIRDRTIQTSTYIARSVLDCCSSDEKCVAMLRIDFEKAFDLVPHDVLCLGLEDVSFGSSIFQGVLMACKNRSTRLIINRAFTNHIRVTFFVRHRWLMSSLLFALFLEPFLFERYTLPACLGFPSPITGSLVTSVCRRYCSILRWHWKCLWSAIFKQKLLRPVWCWSEFGKRAVTSGTKR